MSTYPVVERELYDPVEYHCTPGGSKVSKETVLCGSDRIHFGANVIIKPKVLLRGDLVNIHLGRHVYVSEDACLGG